MADQNRDPSAFDPPPSFDPPPAYPSPRPGPPDASRARSSRLTWLVAALAVVALGVGAFFLFRPDHHARPAANGVAGAARTSGAGGSTPGGSGGPGATAPGGAVSGARGSGLRGPGGTRIVLPSGAAANGLCTGYTSGFGAAQTYIGAAEIGVPQVAQACVYQNRVPITVAESLDGKLFTPTTVDQNATVIEFRSADNRTHISVTTARESDGRYWVIAVTVR